MKKLNELMIKLMHLRMQFSIFMYARRDTLGSSTVAEGTPLLRSHHSQSSLGPTRVFARTPALLA